LHLFSITNPCKPGPWPPRYSSLACSCTSACRRLISAAPQNGSAGTRHVSQMIWARGAEPWRKCGLPVHEELNLDPAKVELIHETSRQYFLKYRQVRADSRSLIQLPVGQAHPCAHSHDAAWRLKLGHCHQDTSTGTTQTCGVWCHRIQGLSSGRDLRGTSCRCRPRGTKQSVARTASTPTARR
jgi:hypothetical protein